MPKEPMIVAEGPGLFPACVYPVLTSPRQAMWLVPTPAFKRALVIKRGKPGVRDQTRDPQRATKNVTASDMLMVQLVRQEALERGLTLCEVDGSRSIAPSLHSDRFPSFPGIDDHGVVYVDAANAQSFAELYSHHLTILDNSRARPDDAYRLCPGGIRRADVLGERLGSARNTRNGEG